MVRFASSPISSKDLKSSFETNFINAGNPSSVVAQYSSPKKVIMNTYKTLFFIRREKQNPDTHKCPIYLRITIDTRTELSLNLEVDPTRWENRKQRVKGSTPESKSLNESLTDIEVKLRNTYNEMSRLGESITAKSLKERYLGKAEPEPQKTVRYLFDFYLQQIRSRTGSEFSNATLKKYQYCYNHLMNFIWKSQKAPDISLTEINYQFIKEFREYLREESTFTGIDGNIIVKKANEHNSTLKYLKMFKTVIKEGLNCGWITLDPFASFKDKFKDVEQVFLYTDELKAIMDKHIQNERLGLVKDLFVFACFTGFAYSDCEKLRLEDLITDKKGRKWITIYRTKSRTPCRVPLLPIAEQIIAKYSQHPICLNKGVLLPMLTNQRYNSYLKEIADISGITKNLTTHVGRRTFASIAINHGVPAETIILIIGHKNFKHLHLYARVDEDKIVYDLEEMKKAFGDYKYAELSNNSLRIA